MSVLSNAAPQIRSSRFFTVSVEFQSSGKLREAKRFAASSDGRAWLLDETRRDSLVEPML